MTSSSLELKNCLKMKLEMVSQCWASDNGTHTHNVRLVWWLGLILILALGASFSVCLVNLSYSYVVSAKPSESLQSNLTWCTCSVLLCIYSYVFTAALKLISERITMSASIGIIIIGSIKRLTNVSKFLEDCWNYPIRRNGNVQRSGKS